MKKTFYLLILFFSLSASSAFGAAYNIDPAHTYVGFSVKHLVISNVKGNFTTFSGNFDFDPKSKKIESAHVVINTASINTNHEKRDKHLRSPDFFDVENNPEMKFTLKESKAAGNELNLKGNLTIRGITKTVALKGEFLGSVIDPWGNQRVAFSLSGNINRFDFGLKWNKVLETGGFVVGKDVKILFEIEGILIKKE